MLKKTREKREKTRQKTQKNNTGRARHKMPGQQNAAEIIWIVCGVFCGVIFGERWDYEEWTSRKAVPG